MTSKSPHLTACVLAADDPQALEATLDSCREAADEIVIVKVGELDGGLTDLASSFGANLFISPPEDSPGAARNLALEKAAGSWILFLEAGETLAGATDAVRIAEAIKNPKHPAFALTVMYGADPETGDTTAEGHCTDPRGALAGSSVRLFPAAPEFRFGKGGELNIPIKVKVGALDAHIHTPGFAEFVDEAHDEAAEMNKSAAGLIDAGQLDEAEQLLRGAHKLLKGHSPLEGSILRNLAFCLIHEGRSREALRVLKGAVEAYPDFTDLYYLTGLAFYDLEEYVPALRNFDFCLTKGDAPPHYGGWSGVGDYRSQREMAEVFLCTGDADRAEIYFRTALKSRPSDGYAMEGLGELLLARETPDEALAVLESLADFSTPEVLRSAVDLFRRAGHPDIAESCQERLSGVEGRN